MKPIYRRGLGLLLILGCAAVWIVTSSMSVRSRRTRTCQGKGSLDVIVADSLERRFVNKEDVAGWMEKEYGSVNGYLEKELLVDENMLRKLKDRFLE